MIDVIYVILITSTALLMGSEFAIAFLIHPSLSKKNHEQFIPAIQVFAHLFGRIMPFWMGATLGVHLIMVWLTWTSDHAVSLVIVRSAITWFIIVVFSVLLPVPINNRVKQWDPLKLPDSWRAERKKWDIYNTIRVFMIIFAFVNLIMAYRALSSGGV